MSSSPYDIYTLKITLYETPVSRTIQVVDCTCLDAFNQLVCLLFGWRANSEYDILYYEEEKRYLAQDAVSLRHLCLNEGEIFEYVYDTFKSHRIHTIELLSVKPLEGSLDEFSPYCLKACGIHTDQHLSDSDESFSVQQIIQINKDILLYWMNLDFWLKYEEDDDDSFKDEDGFPLFFYPSPFAFSSPRPKPRKPKVKGRKVPNYAYKPRGKQPFTYFKKKINAILDWPVRDVNDLNYAIRIFEGWTEQAQKYLDQSDYTFANFICSIVLWNGIYLYEWYNKDFEKQQPRMKKFIRHAFDVLMFSLPHDPSNWRKVQLEDFKKLKAKDMTIFHVKGGINIDDAILKVEKMMS